jgi:hypothetical protein
MKVDGIKGTRSTHVKIRNQYNTSVGNFGGNKPFVRTADISEEDNIKRDLKRSRVCGCGLD